MSRPLPRSIIVRVDDGLRAELEAAATAQRISLSALIRPVPRAALASTPSGDRDPPPAAPAGIPARLAA